MCSTCFHKEFRPTGLERGCDKTVARNGTYDSYCSSTHYSITMNHITEHIMGSQLLSFLPFIQTIPSGWLERARSLFVDFKFHERIEWLFSTPSLLRAEHRLEVLADSGVHLRLQDCVGNLGWRTWPMFYGGVTNCAVIVCFLHVSAVFYRLRLCKSGTRNGSLPIIYRLGIKYSFEILKVIYAAGISYFEHLRCRH